MSSWYRRCGRPATAACCAACGPSSASRRTAWSGRAAAEAGWMPGEGGEFDEGADGGVAGPDDKDSLARVAGAVGAEDVGHPVADPVGRLALADREQAGGNGRARVAPGARGDDDRADKDTALLPLPILEPHLERLCLAPGVTDLARA